MSLTFVVAAAVCAAAPEVLPSGLRPEDVERRPYREYVRQCAELLIQHGTDRYGAVHRPLLMNILDVRTRDCPLDPLALDEPWRVTRRGRRGPAGGNLYADQATLRAMLGLTHVTGDRRFAEFAHRCMDDFMRNLVDERGLFWWGWHRHYDAHRDEKTGHEGNWHEIHVQQAIWPELWDVNRDAVTRQIEAVWQWHVIDKQTGEINRHADGQRGCDFAMSAGEILRAFAFLFARTRNPIWLDRARLVAQYHASARHPETQLIPNRPNAGRERFDGSHFDTSITGLYCHSLLSAWLLSGETQFRDQALAYLKAYGKYGYDASSGRFWGSLLLDGTPERGPRVVDGYAQYEPRGHVDLWQPYVAGYEMPIATAYCYAWALLVTQDPELFPTAARWAACIRREFPPRACEKDSWYRPYAESWAPHGTYAGLYGQTISFFLCLHEARRQAEHLQFARAVAREAVSRLYYNGLFRGHPAKPYYESIDGVGHLLCALLQLDQAMEGKPPSVGWENW